METQNTQLDDIRKVARLVKDYFGELEPQLHFLMFRIESIKPNDEENTYHVYCSMNENFGSSNRITYHLKINIASGKFLSVEKEDES